MAAEQIEHGQVGTRLLGVADVVEGGQIGQPSQHHGRIVDERRRAESPGQVGDRDAGNLGSHERKMTLVRTLVDHRLARGSDLTTDLF